MKVRGGMTSTLAGAAVVAVAGLATTTPTMASAAVPDACALTTEHGIAKSFGLTDARVHQSLLEPPGNAAGVLRDHCRVFAWSGTKPANDKRKREALLAGRLAWLNVDTWVTEQSPYAPVWRAHFDAERKAIRAASVKLFLKRLGGKAFAPPRYGADEAIAYEASTAKVTKLRALWWKRADKSMIELNVEEARGTPALASLKRIAAVIVQRFNDECVYPCEPPATG